MSGQSVAGQTSAALDAFVERAAARSTVLAGTGIPTRRVEAWRYTPLRSITEIVWKEAAPLDAASAKNLLDKIAYPANGHLFIFGNGREVTSLSSLPENVLRTDAEAVDPLEDRFSAVLNGALGRDGLSIRVPKNVDAGLLTLATLHQGSAISTHLRHRIVLEEGASLTLFDANVGEGEYLSNPRFDIILAEGARLRHVKHQSEAENAAHLAIINVEVQGNAEYDSFTLNSGGAVARHEVVTTLAAPHALVHVNGVQVVNGTRLNDLTSMIHHAAPDCNSRQTVKTVLSDTAQGVFQGKILVDRVAQKTDGYQMNQALLLSEKAQINSKPELEIYADDVKCSHGATVGALDDEQLFYLRSRGVPEAEARDILVTAFLTGALELVADEALRELLLRGLFS